MQGSGLKTNTGWPWPLGTLWDSLLDITEQHFQKHFIVSEHSSSLRSQMQAETLPCKDVYKADPF